MCRRGPAPKSPTPDLASYIASHPSACSAGSSIPLDMVNWCQLMSTDVNWCQLSKCCPKLATAECFVPLCASCKKHGRSMVTPKSTWLRRWWPLVFLFAPGLILCPFLELLPTRALGLVVLQLSEQLQKTPGRSMPCLSILQYKNSEVSQLKQPDTSKQFT